MAEQLTYIVIGVRSNEQYDTREYFRECVRTLEQNTTNFNLIFVDDACDEAGSLAIKEVSSRFPSSYTIRAEKQRWFTRAYDLGLRLVKSPWAILLNVDTVLDVGWLEELYAVKDEAERILGQRVGMVGSEFSAEEGRRWQNITSPTTPGNPGYLTGHCLLANMQALHEASVNRGTPGIYLDETKQEMIHIRSDNEISHRLQSLGWATVRSFKAACGHVHGGVSWGHRLDVISALTLEQVND